MTTLREAAQQALEALENTTPTGFNMERDKQFFAAITVLRAALEQQEQEPVACFIGIKGSAFDLPTTKRAYTYEEQPGNVVAWKLGQSLETAKRFPPGGDSIDDGLALLKTLQAEGFGVFQLGAEYTALRDALEEPEQPEQEPVAWLSRDEARLALWQAIHQREFGNPNDDKLILDALRDKGLWIGRISASPERAAVEQPEQEPVAWMVYTLDGKSAFVTDSPADIADGHRALPLYTVPPRGEWVGLTEEEIKNAVLGDPFGGAALMSMMRDGVVVAELRQAIDRIARAIEAALKERNHG